MDDRQMVDTLKGYKAFAKGRDGWRVRKSGGVFHRRDFPAPIPDPDFHARVSLFTPISHPALISYVHFFKTPKLITIISDDVPYAQTLATVLNRRKPLPSGRVIHLFVQIVSAIDALHSFGQVHGNLTLENILILSNLTIRITDFGLHRILGPNYQPQVLPSGHRPIKPRDEPDTFMSDSWALGAILFRLCVLRPPTEPPPFTRDVNRVLTHFPQYISKLIKRLLSPLPERRFSPHKILEFMAQHHCDVRHAGIPAMSVPTSLRRGKLPQQRPVQKPGDPRRDRNMVVNRARVQFCGLDNSDVSDGDDEPKPFYPLQDSFIANLKSPEFARGLHRIDDPDDLPINVSVALSDGAVVGDNDEAEFIEHDDSNVGQEQLLPVMIEPVFDDDRDEPCIGTDAEDVEPGWMSELLRPLDVAEILAEGADAGESHTDDPIETLPGHAEPIAMLQS
jgi:serine/threonine protein kinase